MSKPTAPLTWTNGKRKLRELVPWEHNPRQIKEAEGRRLLESLDTFGQIHPIAIGPGNEIYDGHQRDSVWAASDKYGPDFEVDVRIASRALTVKERGKLVAFLHRGTVGEFDWDKLANLPEIDVADLVEFGFDEAELGVDGTPTTDAEPQIDRAAELNKKWKVKTGDLWRIGEHRLLCGDSTKREDVHRVMVGGMAKLYATDPPYGVAYNDETGSGRGDTIANDENDGEKLQAFLESVFRAWLPSLEKTAAWYLWHAQLTQGFFSAAAGLLIHRQIIWVKPSLIMGHGDYHWKHELCFYGWQQGNRPPFYGQRNQDTVWCVGRESDGIHPTQKPVALWDAPLDNHTKRGDICGEPFAGSGSQFVACENRGRKCYGAELSPDYCAVILERMATAFPSLTIERGV